MFVENVLLEVAFLLRPERTPLVRAHKFWLFTALVFLVGF